jgi:cell division protein FtsX
MRFTVSIIMVGFLLLAGCNVQYPANKQLQQQVSQEEIVINCEIAERAKQEARAVKGVKEVTAVAINSEISVAIKVSGFERLRLKPIREQVHDKIKGINGDYNVYVTSDKKLFTRLQQIEQQTKQAPEESLTDIGSEFKNINKDM